MDLYLPSAEHDVGMTLQEMIEYDTKCGFEDGVPFDSPLELSGMSTFDGDFDIKTFEPLFDLDRLDDLDVLIKDESEEDPDDDDDTRNANRRRRRFEVEEDEEEDMHDTVSSWMNMSAMSNYNLDIENSIMVDPSSVIPSTLPSRAQQQQPTSLSTQTSSSSLVTSMVKIPLLTSTISSSSSISSSPTPNLLPSQKITHDAAGGSATTTTTTSQLFRNRINGNQTSATHQVVLCPANSQNNLVSTSPASIVASSLSNTRIISTNGLASSKLLNGESIVVGSNNTPILAHKATSTISPHPQQISTSVTSANSHLTNNCGGSTISINGFHSQSTISQNGRPTTLHGITRIGHFNSNNKTTNGIISNTKPNKHSNKFKRDKMPEEKVFPKPAYSYSCLIALALKNSNNGSLPVSEIYSFMCEHFPYFRTAPNGWKNSVRHNLSLNKCFEKIEKPVVSGNNQRKGCLWALNPDKANKMDDEVQKWSKKGLEEIKQSMTYPEVLESLERGEMKFETLSGASSCSEDEEDMEEVEPLASPEISSSHPIQPFKIGTTLSPSIVSTGGIKMPQPRLISGNLRSISYLQTQQTTTPQSSSISRPTIVNQGPTTHIHIRKPIQMTSVSTTTTQEAAAAAAAAKTDFGQPTQTLSEINIQSNGSILDDFGNEITIEGDMSILNGANSTLASPHNGSVILRQSSLGTTIRAAPLSTAGFSYTASPLSSPHNRLVLTTAKTS